MTAQILVVDDEPDMKALVLQKFRHQIGDGAIRFLFASDGIEALAMLEGNSEIDMVVADINMPRMDGLTLLQKLRESAENVSTIIVSAYGDMSNIRAAMNRGAFDFVTKPIDFADLEKTIRSANVEAIGHLRRGIGAVDQLPHGLPKDRLELDLQFALGPCLIATRGPIADEALRTFERARELCERLQGPPEHLIVLYWLAVMRGVRGELREALEATGAGIDLAKVRGDQPALINFLRGSALAHILMGRPAEALVRTEEAVATFHASDDTTRIATRAAGQDAGAAALAVMAWALWFLGYPDRAAIQMTAALERADAVMHPHTQAYCQYYASIPYILRSDFTAARLHAERCLSLSEAHGFGLWRNLARIVCGICTAQLEPSSARLEELRPELDDLGRRGQRMGITALYAPLCRLLVQRRRPETVLEIVDEAQKIGRSTDELLFEAELSRLKARALLMYGSPEARLTARPMLVQALAVARSQNARSIELLAARDLADLLREQGARDTARELLAPVYGWFTEGFDTLDLKEAKALLDELHA